MRYSALLLFLINCTFFQLYSQVTANCDGDDPKILLAGDSWAQYMGDDGVHTNILNQYGYGDKYLETETYAIGIFDSGIGPGYTGPEYAVSGSEAREWADTDNYPFIANMVDALNDPNNSEIEWVVLSIGGNDVLAGKSGGGWYKDMDLDNPGSEAALFNTIEQNTLTIINAALAVRPSIKVLLSSYEYPNFDVGFLPCLIYACAKREDLSRDPNNDLITNAELNGMMITTETQRQAMCDNNSRIFYDNGVGLMHHIYGSDNAIPGVLPKPEGTTPYAPGGDPSLPALRENFRITGDPIHLDAEAYEYKVKNQMDNLLFEAFRGNPDATFSSEGGTLDGWVGNNTFGTNGLRMGDDDYKAILSFDTGSLPDNASVTGASIYMHRSGAGFGGFFSGPNPYNSFTPIIDIKNGTFGNPGVESNDATAIADATNVGCFHGDIDQDYYVTRIDIDPSYLEHFNTTGKTQFRVYFAPTGSTPEYVYYFDGSESGFTGDGVEKSGREREGIIYQEKLVPHVEPDGTVTEQLVLIAAVEHRGLSDLMGTTAPFLDLSYELVLPVELLSFTARAKGKEAYLEWESSLEENFLGYGVERSSDGRKWTKIDFVNGLGIDQEKYTYSAIDSYPFNGENYYRLAMEDLDGTIEYSPIRQVTFTNKEDQILAFPNPFEDEINIRFSQPILGQINLELIDVLGRSIRQWQNEKISGDELNLKLDHSIPSGSYWLRVQMSNEVTLVKVSKS